MTFPIGGADDQRASRLSSDVIEIQNIDAAEHAERIYADSDAAPILRLTPFLNFIAESMRAPSNDVSLDVLRGIGDDGVSQDQKMDLLKQRIQDWFESVHEQCAESADSVPNTNRTYLDAAEIGSRAFAYTKPESAEYDVDQNPVLTAADFADSAVLQLLIGLGESPNAESKEGFTPAMLAARSAVVAPVRTLFELGADFGAVTEDREDTAMHLAAMDSGEDTLKFLASKGFPVDKPNAFGETPLHLACAQNRSKNVATLLAFGADANRETQQGAKPLHIAAAAGAADAVQALLAVQQDGSNSPLVSQVDVDDRMRSGETPLHVASANGYVDVALALLTHGANVEAVDNARENAAFRAAQSGHNDILRLLESYGADLSVGRSTLGQETPAHAAAFIGHTETLRVLNSLGVPLNVCDAGGRTPAHYAVCGDTSKSSTILQVLDELGVNLDQADGEKLTPLHFAVATDNVPAIRTLLKYSAKVSNRSSEGYLPVDYAAMYNTHRAADELCRQGVGALNERLHKGISTAHVAAAAGSTDVLKVFQRYGLNLSLKDEEGNTPADTAKRCQKPLTAHWLNQLSQTPV